MTHRILVVDDDQDNLETTAGLLRRWGYAVDIAESGPAALSRLKDVTEPYAVALIDYRMPEMDGAALTREIRTINTEMVILIYSATQDRGNIKISIRAGAADFIDKDEDLDYLREKIAQSAHEYEERRRTVEPRQEPDEIEKRLASMNIVGRSDAMGKVGSLILKCRATTSTVLLVAETGGGKELAAHALHTGRSDQFFAVNCASWPGDANTLESELFGHVKGSFTGAVADRVGILERAKGGAVFLDEVHHLSASAQTRLLRAVREKQIRRFGGDREYAIDCRIIAAAQPDLESRVADGRFAKDLYYRLNVLRIDIPALRERIADIEPLVHCFTQRWNQKTSQRRSFLVKTIREMEGYPWPGNVGELQGCVERLLTYVDDAIIRPEHLDERFHKKPQRDESDSRLLTFSDLEAKQMREQEDFL